MPELVLVHGEQGAQEERARLVRLCARLVGEPDAAEDLAQEALYLAWRDRGRLRDPGKRSQWLAGIARNVCQEWRRRRRREHARLTHQALAPGGEPHAGGRLPSTTRASAQTDGGWVSALDAVPDGFDLEVELERRELAQLLDRAMGLLSPDTRAILAQRYLEDRPQAQVALQLGLSEGAVEARLHRGKRLLRRVLLTELRDAALAFGLVRSDDGGWQPTRIWCPSCGERTLVGRFTEQGRLALHCVGCRAVAHVGLPRNRWTEAGWPSLFRGVHAFKPALNRLLGNAHVGFGTGIVGRTSRCGRCGTAPPLAVEWEAHLGRWVAGARCPRCRQQLGAVSTDFVLLARPEGRRFWREHPRIRPVPERDIEVHGRPAILRRYQSVTDSAELSAIFARDTFRLLLLDGAPAGSSGADPANPDKEQR